MKHYNNTKLIKDEPNPEADAEAIAMLHRVDALRAELRALEPQLSKAITAYGRRHNYYLGYREWSFRNDIARMQGEVA
jgi:hypothetical protein